MCILSQRLLRKVCQDVKLKLTASLDVWKDFFLVLSGTFSVACFSLSNEEGAELRDNTYNGKWKLHDYALCGIRH